MQNRYAGDVGDFSKFGLLRHLFSSNMWRLGIVWYLFPDEKHNEDGKHIKYLSKPEFISCDEFLINEFSKIVHSNRNVKNLERAKLLNTNTTYFDECLDFYQHYPGQSKIHKEKRLNLRTAWVLKALKKIDGCNAVFVDPDNGLEVSSCSKLSQAKSGKYIYYSEIQQLFNRRDVIVIYHHLNRHKNHGSHSQQIEGRSNILKQEINPSGRIFALRYKPYSPRAYFILCNKNREIEIQKSLNVFLNTPWKKHWDSYYEA